MTSLRTAALLRGVAVPSLADVGIVDATGHVVALLYRGQDAPVRTDLILADKGWTRSIGLSSSESLSVTRGEESVWQGRLPLDPHHKLQFRQSVSEVDGRLRIALEYTALQDLDAQGLYFRINIPWQEFSGGTAEIGSRWVTLPNKRPVNASLLSSSASELRVLSPSGNLWWSAALNRALHVNLQDKSTDAQMNFAFWISLHSGSMAAGTHSSVTIDLSLDGIPDASQAHLSIQSDSRRYLFHGFGGNYAFQIESPVTDYTLEHIHSHWARTEITLIDWEPEHEGGSTAGTRSARMIEQDRPGTRLRREFELMRRLKDKSISFIASVWRLPAWMLTGRGTKGPWGTQRTIDPAMFDDLVESIAAYMMYARDQYGVEPDLFSCNEPDLGICILFTPEEHRDAIIRIGSRFAALGLRTRMLLGDTSHARGTHTYALPAAEDPVALQYCGAISFHSWNGATPEQYQAWADLAERLQLPLLVAELGADPSAWQGRAYDSYWYGITELRLCQEVLTHARPQSAMYWEFTADYSLVQADGEELRPTGRFWLMRQLANLTPPMSTALEAFSDCGKVLLTAFRAGGVYAVHIANISAARNAVITGLPAGVTTWRAVMTTEDAGYLELAPLAAQDGGLSLSLPARSLLTLTNLPGPLSPAEATP
ncbi:MAG TPA: hypothetical protein PKJ41_08920 [Bryobacteraceae bacterium]|nr:hypothetical protein [Bryobacteraceae bacterium]HPT26213.1 hypothetical protein [Bryobacteraceae bacterium]